MNFDLADLQAGISDFVLACGDSEATMSPYHPKARQLMSRI